MKPDVQLYTFIALMVGNIAAVTSYWWKMHETTALIKLDLSAQKLRISATETATKELRADVTAIQIKQATK